MTQSPPETTLDAFLGGAVLAEQPVRGYRAGLDAVLLAAAAGVDPGASARVLDAGAGVGVAGLCLAQRCPRARVVLVEREPQLAALAQSNIARNGLQQRVHVVTLDVEAGGAALHRPSVAGLAELVPPAAFTHVIANPPYNPRGAASPGPKPLKAAAHQMPQGGLSAWVRFLATAAARDGMTTMIHRADALAPLLAEFDGRFGALRVLPIHPRAGQPASRIIVQGIKGSRAPLTLLAGLVLHDDGHAFRAEVDAVLRSGAALHLGG